MNPTYIIFILTFLIFPIIGLVLSKYINPKKVSRLFKPTIAFFLMHNILFAIGYSVKGDYFDYCIFSLEYSIFCFVIFLLFKYPPKNSKLIRALGMLIFSIGFIIGAFGILFFIIFCQDYETDKVFHFTSNAKDYETRRYSFGAATLDDTRYTFETYRNYRCLPFEKKIDKTDFFALKTNLQIREDELQISILTTGDKEQLLFKSTNGHTFLKPLN